MSYAQKSLPESLMGRDHYGDQGIDEKIILTPILNKYNNMLLRPQYGTLGQQKCGGFLGHLSDCQHTTTDSAL
jgi:hypothetical protein